MPYRKSYRKTIRRRRRGGRTRRTRAFAGKRLAIARVPRPITYRHRQAYMKTRETYKFYVQPKLTTVADVKTQHPVMIDIVLNSPYSFTGTTYKSIGADMIVNSEPSIVGYTGTNGDAATVVPGLYEDSSRPGGDRSQTYAGAKFANAMIVGASVQSNYTPVMNSGVACQPGYIAHIRSSSNDFGGLTQDNASYETLSKIPFVQWKRVRGPATGIIGGNSTATVQDPLTRSVNLKTNHSVAKWNNVTDLNDSKDRFAWHLNNPDPSGGIIPQERDHLTWALIPELTQETLGGVATPAPAGVLTLTINKTIRFSEPLSGKAELDTANLPPVYGSKYLKPLFQNYGAGALLNATKRAAFRHRR